jgi:hypothetical protein
LMSGITRMGMRGGGNLWGSREAVEQGRAGQGRAEYGAVGDRVWQSVLGSGGVMQWSMARDETDGA